MTTTAVCVGGPRRPTPCGTGGLSEVFLPEAELEIATNSLYLATEAARPAEEHLDGFGPMLLRDLGQLHVRLALQPSQQVGVALLVK